MATYGLRITPDDGGKQLILDGSARFASYLGSANVLKQTQSYGGFKAQPANSKALIIPRNVVWTGVGDQSGPPMIFVSNMSFDGNLNITVEAIKANQANTSLGVIDVFSVQYASNPSATYGLRITNGANFLEISDASYNGFVLYRGIVDINGQWDIPSSVTSFGQYIVFARWNNADIPLFFDREANALKTYGAFSSVDGSVQGGVITGVMIVIVSCGYSPALPASGYGLVIRNAAGQITFSSKYPPVMWTDAYYDFDSFKAYGDSSGDYLTWRTPVGTVSNPMIPLCVIGTQRGDWTRTSGNYTFKKLLLSGFKMSGNSVTTARAKSTFSDIEQYTYPRAIQIGCQLPCLEASYYF